MKVLLLGANNPQTVRIIDTIRENQGRAPGCPERMEFLGFIDNDSSKKGTDFHGYRVFGGFEVLDDFFGDDVHIVNTITQTMAIRYETTREVVRRGFPLAKVAPGRKR